MFTYSAPTSIEEALDALSEWGSRARILAGGQTLLPLIHSGRLSPDHLVDINGVRSLDFVELRDDLTVGACCRQHVSRVFLQTRRPHSLIAQALPLIADNEIRNRGTICGSLAAAPPGAELPAIALTYNASLRIRSKRGDREISATSLYQEDGTVTLEPDEILDQRYLSRQRSQWGRNRRDSLHSIEFPRLWRRGSGRCTKWILLRRCASLFSDKAFLLRE